MSITDELIRLGRLREDGLLTADDFMQAMAQVVAGWSMGGAVQPLASPAPSGEAPHWLAA